MLKRRESERPLCSLSIPSWRSRARCNKDADKEWKKNAHVLWDAWCALMGADSNHVFSRVKRGERWITRLYRAKQGFLTDKQESTLKVARRLSLYPDKTQDSVHTSLRLVYGLDDKSGEMEFAVRNFKSTRTWRRETTQETVGHAMWDLDEDIPKY